MKNSIILGFCLLIACTALHAQGEKIEVTLSQPGKPYTVDLGLVHGSIKVVKGSGSDLVIEATGAKRHSAAATKDGMRRISSGGGFELSVEEKANKVKINPGLPLNTVFITLYVPANGTFNLQTVNSGNIHVDNVEGKFELSNVNGKIILNNVAGSAVVSTVNGDVSASFVKVAPNTPMAFSTLNGKIDVSLPSSVKVNVKARTDRGDIFSDFEIGVLKASSNVVRKNEGGFTKIEAAEWVTGSINGGGAEMMMKTFNGNIYIRKQ